ncbi:hypothetical protein EVAR_71544_1 [Eumeta japonica]|uniref:Uncharacterized protein n=1 Tax=Eumeta variegata TaxID=151549 RepID=A0A4C1SZ70_EUMVA|nr:hypothetical protein EVAR_71544_1 [Eumeta japonica]
MILDLNSDSFAACVSRKISDCQPIARCMQNKQTDKGGESAHVRRSFCPPAPRAAAPALQRIRPSHPIRPAVHCYTTYTAQNRTK